LGRCGSFSRLPLFSPTLICKEEKVGTPRLSESETVESRTRSASVARHLAKQDPWVSPARGLPPLHLPRTFLAQISPLPHAGLGSTYSRLVFGDEGGGVLPPNDRPRQEYTKIEKIAQVRGIRTRMQTRPGRSRLSEASSTLGPGSVYREQSTRNASRSSTTCCHWPVGLKPPPGPISQKEPFILYVRYRYLPKTSLRHTLPATVPLLLTRKKKAPMCLRSLPRAGCLSVRKRAGAKLRCCTCTSHRRQHISGSKRHRRLLLCRFLALRRGS
jgi:hypothetical protein